MTREEAKSCIGTIEMLQRLAYNIHGVMDVIDADNCKKIIKALEQESVTDFADRCQECGKTIKQKYTDEVLDKIRVEIESYKLSEDELSDMDEDSVKWGMKIAYDIVDKYKAESEE